MECRLAVLVQHEIAVAHPKGAVGGIKSQAYAAKDSRVESAQERPGVGEVRNDDRDLPIARSKSCRR